LAMVRDYGVSEVQGFLFSPPLQPSTLANLLHSEANKTQIKKRAS